MAVRLTAVVGQVTVKPLGALPVRVTEPAKLKLLANETLSETPVWPTFRLVPLAIIVKSPT